MSRSRGWRSTAPAIANGAELVSADRRALGTYEAIGVAVLFVGG